MPSGGAYQYRNTSSAKLHGARQRHQNVVKFDPLRHKPEEALPPQVLRMLTSLCCRRCQLILQWKLNYGKYPSLVQIRKALKVCGICKEKNVAIPFHHLCQGCAREACVCAKCQKNPEESEMLAQAALKRASINEPSSNSDDDDAEEEEEEEDDEDEDDDDERRAMRHDTDEAAAERLAKLEEERARREQDEADFPELIKLRGLDVSVLRAKLYEERTNSTVSALNTQGRLRERNRRTAMRQMEKGNESGAANTISTAMRSGEQQQQHQQDNDEDDVDDDDNVKTVPAAVAAAASSKPKPKPKPVVLAGAGDTSSDEETL